MTSESKAVALLQVKVERATVVRRKGQVVTTIELVASVRAEELAAMPEKFRAACMLMVQSDIMVSVSLRDEVVAEHFDVLENEGPGDEAFLEEQDVMLEGGRLHALFSEETGRRVGTNLAFKVRLKGYKALELSRQSRVGSQVWLRIA